MTIRITQIENEAQDRATLRLEGKLLAADAEIVRQVFEELAGRVPVGIEIDLSRISFINSDSAAVLKNLESRGAVLKGLDFFTGKVIETYEMDQKNKE